MDEAIANFIAVTDLSSAKAEQYLRIADGNLEQALQLFFDGIEIDAPGPPSQPSAGARAQPIAIDDDEEADLQQAIRSSRFHDQDDDSMTGFGEVEDDEAMARRLQEELNASSSNGVRAPIARTRETLVGPEDDFVRRAMPSARGPRTGIFNQRAPSVWDPESAANDRRRVLSEATGGASEASAKSNKLAEMYRPPYEILSHFDLSEAREEARDSEKWILVNIQEQGNFQSQVLNRDIWKVKEVMDTVRENFIFLQFDRDGPDGRDYIRLYMPHAQNIPRLSNDTPFPHIAIIDPRTGEKVKEWHDMPKDALSFVMDVHDFLSRFSLSEDARNPVAPKVPSPKIMDVDSLTEEEMLRIAMQNSLEGDATGPASPPRSGKRKITAEEPSGVVDLSDSDRPATKRAEAASEDTKTEEAPGSSAYASISPVHHEEPAASVPGTTRIQFRFHDGSRVVRRFLLNDRVSRIYEWLKADLIPAKFAGDASKEFELVSIGTKLIEQLDRSIEKAGLKNGTVMVGVLSDD